MTPPTPSESLNTHDARPALEAAGDLDTNLNILLPQADLNILPVVGLGGSAGSIKPLQEFFGLMPPDSGLAFVVVIHMAPDHESSLPQILQARTTMPVVAVLEPVEIQPNHVYVIPPGHHLTLREGKIELSKPELEIGRRVAVDLLFRSLAASHRSRSVAIVLSGMDSDGAVGIKRIKEGGGVTIAQDPDEAEQSGMPRSALDTGMVDWMLPVRAMPARVLGFWRNENRLRFPSPHPPRSEPSSSEPSSSEPGAGVGATADADGDANEVALREILAFVQARTEHDFSRYKRPTVLRRIGRRLQVNSLADFPTYARFLRTHAGEAGALLQDLLISVTNFFRDKGAFAALEAELPRLFRGKGTRDVVRVWVPGCATGEEAYSLAMLLLERAGELEPPPQIQIFATDLDEVATRAAREGLYPAAIAADVSPERLRRFFTSEQGRYRVKKEVREMILFASHNLLKDSPFSRLDLVSCRNLLIYFDVQAQERVFHLFHFALKSDGLLFLGSSESIEEASALFAPLDKRHRIFTVRPAPRPSIATLPLPSAPRVPHVPPSASIALPAPSVPPALLSGLSGLAPAVASERAASFGELHLQLLEQYAPPAVLVNEAYEVMHLSPQASKYLSLAPGEISINLLAMVRPALRLELRAALFRAVQSGLPATAAGIPVELGETTRPVNIHVRPWRDEQAPDASARFLLVIFEEGDQEVEAWSVAEDDPLASRLENEIRHLKARLQEIVEQSEASNEDLKASNEELQAMNEELRSSGEELETGKEEIQAANEELTTLNHELRLKVEEISRVNGDLSNLMSSTDIATVFLDRELRIKRYTPRALDLFQLSPTDLGRPLWDLRHRLRDESLAQDAAQVLETLHTTEREVLTADGRCFILRALPYRTQEDRIDGVVLTFLDITERKRYVEALLESEERHRLIVEGVHEHAIFTLDERGLITSWNPAAQRVLGWSEAEALGQPSEMLFAPEERVLGVPAAGLSEAAAQGRAPDDGWRVRKDGSRFFASGVTTALRHEDLSVRGFVKILRDMTEQARSEEELRASEERYRTLFNSSDGGFCVIEMIFDEQERARDFLIVETNPAFERHNGIKAGNGRTIRELVPGLEEHWFETYGQVARSGQPARFEAQALATPIGGWFDVYAFRLGGPGSRKVAVLLNNITGRKRQQQSVEFLAQVNASLALLAGPEEIARTVAETIGKYLGASRVLFCELSQPSDQARVLFSWSSAQPGSAQPGSAQLGSSEAGSSEASPAESATARPLSELASPSLWPELKAGQAVAVAVSQSRSEAGVSSSALYAPFLSDGRWKFLLVCERAEAWREDEVSLMRELPSHLWLRLERARSEAALRQSEERLRIAVEAAELGTCDWSYQAGEMRGNALRFVLLGLDPQPSTISTRQFLDALHPEDRESAWALINRHIEERGWFRVEYRVVHPGGAVRWILEAGRIVEQDEDGLPLLISSILADVTARREAEQVLVRSRDEMETLVGERTGELEQVNRALQAEVAQRKSAQTARELLLRRLVSAQEEERRRISRELHDQMGQTLTALMMGLKSLPDLPDPGLTPPSSNQTIQKLQNITTELMSAVHHLAWELRPAVLDNLGLEAALGQYVGEWARRGEVRADFLSHGLSPERLPEHIESALYRTVQEALTNVARHAGATSASVLLERIDGEVSAIVEDDGQGFDTEAQGKDSSARLGLLGMRERVELVGGSLTIESSLGLGTTVYARVPIGKNHGAPS